MTHKRFAVRAGQVFDTKRAVVCPDSGAVVIREKGKGRKPPAHTTGDAALDLWLAEQRSKRAPAPTWDDDVPF